MLASCLALGGKGIAFKEASFISSGSGRPIPAALALFDTLWTVFGEHPTENPMFFWLNAFFCG